MLPEEVQLVFCLFDILHLDGEPLAKLPLRIRHEKLAAAIKAAPTAGVVLENGETAIKARLLPILPGNGAPLMPGSAASAAWSVRGSTAADVVVRPHPFFSWLACVTCALGMPPGELVGL